MRIEESVVGSVTILSVGGTVTSREHAAPVIGVSKGAPKNSAPRAGPFCWAYAVQFRVGNPGAVLVQPSRGPWIGMGTVRRQGRLFFRRPSCAICGDRLLGAYRQWPLYPQ